MSQHDYTIEHQAQALRSLISAIPTLEQAAFSEEELQSIAAQQLFTPAQNERLAYWFARFMTIRKNLWEIVNTARDHTNGISTLSAQQDWQYFVLAYSAVTSLVRIDRFLLNKVAFDSTVQRKLNEGFPEHRIDRKQYSHIYSALTSPANAVQIYEAHRALKKKSLDIRAAVENTPLFDIYENLFEQERYMDTRWHRYLLARLRYRRHSLRRRGASAKQKSMFALLEVGGRMVSELHLRKDKKVDHSVRTQMQRLLKPGDIFVTRHQGALTNLFLPGYWPHAALYVGYENIKAQVDSEPHYTAYWKETHCTFEALKDGVYFRPLTDTLNVDAFVVLRPTVPMETIIKAISRVVVHAGKSYNFDFDFFRSDQLVCTEVIYRAFDGLDGIQIPLVERMGRKTLSAEDLLDISLQKGWLQPLAIYGSPGCEQEIVTGPAVDALLRASYCHDNNDT